MQATLVLDAIASQTLAGLAMLRQTIECCPDHAWDQPVGVYPFWQVAYHVLCYVDFYSAPDNDSWRPDQRPDGLHPLGRTELDEEFPSRRFERTELLPYTDKCKEIVLGALARETESSLRGPSGFAHLPMPRLELYLYTLRHLQHHTGQLGALLRRIGVDTGWRKAGWPA
jgi:hypothetical protein